MKAGPKGYSSATAYVLLQLSLENESNADVYTHLIRTATMWLQLEEVRLHFIEANNAMLLLRTLEASYARSSSINTGPYACRSYGLSEYGSVESRLRSALIGTLADASSTPHFVSRYTIESQFVETLQKWLLKGLPQLQACACIVLANMANSDVNRIFMLHHFRVHEILLPLLESSSSAHLRASAAYYLKALLVSGACQQFLSNRPIIRAASCLWGTTHSPHLQYMGVTLANQAIKGSYNLLRQLFDPLSSDHDSPAHDKTFLSLLLQLWRDYYGYRQHEQLTSEVSWTVVNVCSMLWSLRNVPDIKELQNRLLLNHKEIANPLIMLLMQDHHPVARSKVLFLMAVLAQEPLGAEIVSNIIEAAEVFALVSALISQASGSIAAEQEPMRCSCDQRNALILMGRLQKNKVSIHNFARKDCANNFRIRCTAVTRSDSCWECFQISTLRSLVKKAQPTWMMDNAIL